MRDFILCEWIVRVICFGNSLGFAVMAFILNEVE
jgi:hypothetical protein